MGFRALVIKVWLHKADQPVRACRAAVDSSLQPSGLVAVLLPSVAPQQNPRSFWWMKHPFELRGKPWKLHFHHSDCCAAREQGLPGVKFTEILAEHDAAVCLVAFTGWFLKAAWFLFPAAGTERPVSSELGGVLPSKNSHVSVRAAAPPTRLLAGASWPAS